MTEDEFDALREEMDEQREELLADLSDDLGGDPEDYRVGDRAVTDGGE